MTTQPTPPLDEYRALRSGYGVVELAGWSSVTFTGADRQAFLHNFTTNDVKRLSAGEHCETFVTNVKGKTIGHGLVHCRADELVFITVPGQAAPLITHWQRYIIREDVAVRDTTAERIYCLLAGGESAGAGLNGEIWIRWRMLDVPFCGLLEVAPERRLQVRSELTKGGATTCSYPAFDTLRIESGMPLYGVDFGEGNFPQEVGRDELAISFTKGCYLGQETVARIDSLGHVNQLLVGVQFEGTTVPAAKTELAHGETSAGQVTSATFSPRLGAPLGLAMVRRPWTVPATQLASAGGPCTVVELPLRE